VRRNAERPRTRAAFRYPADKYRVCHLHDATYLDLGFGQHPVADMRANKIWSVEVNLAPEISGSSLSSAKNLRPGTRPGSDSTSTSTPLSSPKSSRRTDPNSASLRIWLRRQNPARLSRSISMRLLSTGQPSFPRTVIFPTGFRYV